MGVRLARGSLRDLGGLWPARAIRDLGSVCLEALLVFIHVEVGDEAVEFGEEGDDGLGGGIVIAAFEEEAGEVGLDAREAVDVAVRFEEGGDSDVTFAMGQFHECAPGLGWVMGGWGHINVCPGWN